MPHYELEPFVRYAAAFWTEHGVSREEVRQLRQVEIFVTDLPGDFAGLTTTDGILIDAALLRREARAVVLHETGHVVGLRHGDDFGRWAEWTGDRLAHEAAFACCDDWRFDDPPFFGSQPRTR